MCPHYSGFRTLNHEKHFLKHDGKNPAGLQARKAHPASLSTCFRPLPLVTEIILLHKFGCMKKRGSIDLIAIESV
jgi:hypothetical protein